MVCRSGTTMQSVGRMWAAASARNLARRLRRQWRMEEGQTKAMALHYRVRLLREGLSAHWSLSEEVGRHQAAAKEALESARLLGVRCEDVVEKVRLANWARHAPPPGSAAMPRAPVASLRAQGLEDFRALLYAGPAASPLQAAAGAERCEDDTIEGDDMGDEIVFKPASTKVRALGFPGPAASPLQAAAGEERGEGKTIKGDVMCDEIVARFKPWRWPRPASTKSSCGDTAVVDKKGVDETDGVQAGEALQAPREVLQAEGPVDFDKKEECGFVGVQCYCYVCSRGGCLGPCRRGQPGYLEQLRRDDARAEGAGGGAPSQDSARVCGGDASVLSGKAVPAVFKDGEFVFAKGLASAKELNGQLGRIKCWYEDRGRYAVKFVGGDGPMLLKPENLQFASASALAELVARGETGKQSSGSEDFGLPQESLFGGQLTESPNLRGMLQRVPAWLR